MDMAVIDTLLTQIQGSNLFLFIVLILLFVIGYKVLQAVIRLALISVLSGVFLVVLDVVGIGPAVTFNRFILFMVLGTGLFIFYSSIATVATLVRRLYSGLSRTVTWAFKSTTGATLSRQTTEHTQDSGPGVLTRLWRWIRNRRNSTHHPTPATSNTPSNGPKEKTIILDELDDED